MELVKNKNSKKPISVGRIERCHYKFLWVFTYTVFDVPHNVPIYHFLVSRTESTLMCMCVYVYACVFVQWTQYTHFDMHFAYPKTIVQRTHTLTTDPHICAHACIQPEWDGTTQESYRERLKCGKQNEKGERKRGSEWAREWNIHSHSHWRTHTLTYGICVRYEATTAAHKK